MKVIPVIDLKNGVVVHAKRGERENYQPIKSVLTTKADIYSVLNGFLQLHAFDTFYIADLDAITGQGRQHSLIEQVAKDFPKITFWVDAGYQKAQHFLPNYLPVLGSECFTDDNFYEILEFEKRFILSLDFGSKGEKLGSQNFFTQAELWSENVIVMTLNRVGSSQGVAIDLLTEFKRDYPKTNFIAAGGVRNCDDLAKLEKMGIEQVLVASALHSGAITKNNFIKF
ncbi:MAG: HisA/HisF-related TIM barrel protein [Methylococcales bacterium]|nr:HisA/HisF-related TIM barrel protein [Methylococcales bacterium]